MSLTPIQIEYIVAMDSKANDILAHGGGQEELLLSLADKIFEIKGILDSAEHSELDYFCEKYDGFYHYMKLMESLAKGCADGIFNDIIKK